ncbi:hypothetical protein [Rhizobium glycinendophyticum]|uniref:Uncharacterized protein n=1 Tax=Rhizobium glycinendophyticum TaxID=2589807 RepID=A0A504TWZ3_9HYPH|nr:hypothetical protein [Rhizobium glycinendophyticum]TPP07024.1 hypothetical protein FJQ55_15290 [Rhizobium glycinendophyticum]
MTIRQSDIARELDVSEMTISRAMKAIGRNGNRLTEADIWALLVMSDLQHTCRMAPHVSAELVTTFSSELLYLAGDPARKCWITFCETEQASFQLASLTERHLASILDAVPMALTLPLHQSVDRARQRLTAMKTRKAAA